MRLQREIEDNNAIFCGRCYQALRGWHVITVLAINNDTTGAINQLRLGVILNNNTLYRETTCSIDEVISFIEDGGHIYTPSFDSQGRPTEVQVIEEGAGRYLRSLANQTREDNLESLPFIEDWLQSPARSSLYDLWRKLGIAIENL